MTVMRNIVPAALLAVLVTGWPSQSNDDSAPRTDVPAGVEIDGGHSSVVFRCLHLGVSPFWGTFDKVSGSIAIDEANLGDAKVSVTVDTTSVDSNNSGRDKHLLGPDFLNAKQFPTATFESTSVKRIGDDTFAITGKFTLVGKTKEITVTAKRTGAKNIGGRFGYREGWEADFTFKRSDHGMSYGVERGMIGDEVRMILGIEGMRK